MASTAIATKNATVDARGFIISKAKGFEARDRAFRDIQVHAFSEGVSRSALIAAIRKALGKAPTTQALEIAQREFVIGRVAARLPEGEYPKAGMDTVARLDHVRELVMHYAMPIKDGQRDTGLRGKKGRRSIAQHKAIRAAAEAWSQVKAEIAPEQSNAKTQAQKNAQKAAAVKNGASAGSGRGKKGNATTPTPTLTHPELVKAPSEMTPVEARAHVVTQAASLLSFANKYAGQLPTDFGKAVRAFKAAVDKAEALAASVDAE